MPTLRLGGGKISNERKKNVYNVPNANMSRTAHCCDTEHSYTSARVTSLAIGAGVGAAAIGLTAYALTRDDHVSSTAPPQTPIPPEMTQTAEQICGSGYSAWEEASGKDCRGGCLNSNFGYDSLSEAKSRCDQTSSCDGIMKYHNDKYYLRKGNDQHISHPGVSYCRRL